MLGPDVVSVMMTSGEKTWLNVGVYIPPTFHKDIYEEAIDGIRKAAAMAETEEAELVVLGDLNVDVRGITNSRMELLQGNFNGQDERRAATIGALSSLGLEDTGRRFRQRDRIGLWTWSQVRQGRRIQLVCDYILTYPTVTISRHHIR